MVCGQPLQAHRTATASSCASHARRACGPSSRRSRGHMLTNDSGCTNRSRSSRWASASSRAYSARHWPLSPTSYTRRPDQATCSGNSTSPAAGPFRSAREHGSRRAYSPQRGGRLPVSIKAIGGSPLTRSCAGQVSALPPESAWPVPGLTCGFCSADRRSTPAKWRARKAIIPVPASPGSGHAAHRRQSRRIRVSVRLLSPGARDCVVPGQEQSLRAG